MVHTTTRVNPTQLVIRVDNQVGSVASNPNPVVAHRDRGHGMSPIPKITFHSLLQDISGFHPCQTIVMISYQPQGQISDFKHQVDMITAETGKLRLEFDTVKSEVYQLHLEIKSAVEKIKVDQRAALDIESRLLREMLEKRKTETNVQICELGCEVEKCRVKHCDSQV